MTHRWCTVRSVTHKCLLVWCQGHELLDVSISFVHSFTLRLLSYEYYRLRTSSLDRLSVLSEPTPFPFRFVLGNLFRRVSFLSRRKISYCLSVSSLSRKVRLLFSYSFSFFVSCVPNLLFQFPSGVRQHTMTVPCTLSLTIPYSVRLLRPPVPYRLSRR